MNQVFKVFVSFLVLVIYLGCLKQNEPPVIQSLTANSQSIYINEITQLTCVATDPDGDNLTYSWSSTNGYFPDNNTAGSVTWNAPDEPGNHTITISVSDGKTTTVKTIVIEVLQTANVEGYVYYSGTKIPVSGVHIVMGDEQFTTDKSGIFIIEAGLGVQTIKAEKDGFNTYTGNITVVKGSNKIKVEITSDSFTKRIYGTLKNSYDLIPVEGVKIVVLNPDESESELSSTTSSSGSYEIQSVPKGYRSIKVIHPYYRSIHQEIIIAETDIKLDINMDCSPPETETVGTYFVGLDSVVLEGIVSSNCNQNVKTGFCYSEKLNPTINDDVIEVFAESGILKKVISVEDVEPLTTYYYRAFVQTDFEIVYGDVFSFLLGILVDERNNENRYYVTSKIGEQLWMAENLAYLPEVNPPAEISSTEPNYFVYGYNGTSVNEAKANENYGIYGVLYNWPAAKEACPNGWHLPTNEDWEQLAKYISDQNGGYNNKENYWYNVGVHLKAETLWYKNGVGTDEYGFSGFPGGFCSFDGGFYNIETDGYWWSATEENNTSAWFRYTKFSSISFFRGSYHKNMGYCVRCLKD